MKRRKIENGALMRWKVSRNADVYRNVRVLQAVKRHKGEWQKYHIQDLETGKSQIVQGNTLFSPVPKFTTVEEAEAWLESQQ